MSSRRLGRGINALFPGNDHEVEEGRIEEISVKDLRPNPYQPRTAFADEAIDELKISILEHGILQPLIVRKSLKGYEIIAGERRFRAAQSAGLKKVPAIVKDFTDEKMMEVALVENLQRENLNPVEEAIAYKKLMEVLGLTQEQLAKKLGKSRPHLANHLRLLHLDEAVQSLISERKLSMGHGRALLSLKDQTKQPMVIDQVLKDNLNVRQLESLIQQLNENVPRGTKRKKPKKDLNPELKQTEHHLKQKFGTAVSIKPSKNKDKGKIEIEYFSNDDLNRVLEILGK